MYYALSIWRGCNVFLRVVFENLDRGGGDRVRLLAVRLVHLAEHRDVHVQRVAQNVQIFPVLRHGSLRRIDGIGPQCRERVYAS